MKKAGFLELVTGDTKRKMNYVQLDNKIYMFTNPNTNKLKAIKENNRVKIDINDKDYIANVSEENIVKRKVEKAMIENLSFVHKFIFKKMHKEDQVVIILEEA